MNWNPYRAPIVFALVVFVSILLLYTAYDKSTQSLDFERLGAVLLFSVPSQSLNELNKAAALSGLALVSVAFLLGPVSRLWPAWFARRLFWRKGLGLSGFAFIVFHSVYSVLVFYAASLDNLLFSNPKWLGAVLAIIAFAIFLVMSLTSTKAKLQQMGYNNWKRLQTFGYVGLFFGILHFWILETKPGAGFDVRPYGLFIFALAVAALVLRVALFLKKDSRKQFEEHYGEPPPKNNQTG